MFVAKPDGPERVEHTIRLLLRVSAAGSGSEFRADPKGQVIELRFAGTKTVQVTITGRNLWRLYDYLHQHRIPWIMRADRDFPDGDDKKSVVTGTAINPVREAADE